MSRFHRTAPARLKWRRRYPVVLGGLFWVLALSPAQATGPGSPACRWQPIVNGLRHLRPPGDLALDELNCGIGDPIDFSPAIAPLIEAIDESARDALNKDSPLP